LGTLWSQLGSDSENRVATISKHRGKWKCQVRRKGHPAQSKNFDTKAEAEAWGVQIEAEIGRGVFLAPDKATQSMTVADLLDRYVKEESIHKASESDDKTRAETLKAAIGGYGVADLTNAMLAGYKRARMRIRASQTVLHELNLLHRAYVIAVAEWGLVLPRGIPKTARPQLPEGRERRVTQEEIEAIIRETGSKELKAIVVLAVETAMRRGEILGLHWDHVNLPGRSLFLPKTKTKTPRTVPLSSRAVALLGSLECGPGKVFSITPRCASQAFKRAADRLGLVNIHMHDLRHEATSRLFEKDLNVIEVSKVTGHKSLVMLNRYSHLSVQHIADKLG
jgi:integrase